jgi:N-acetylglucosamine kinase-like BadF-type ATPase
MPRSLPAMLALLALAGCGQSDDRAGVRSTTERFLGGVLASDTRKALESEESKPCPQAIGSVDVSGGAVVHVQVAITSAKVDLAGGESFFLSEEKSGWRIAALGCRPTTTPTRTPFDCALEA